MYDIASQSIKEKIQQLKAIDNEVIKLTTTAKKLRVEISNTRKGKVRSRQDA